MRITRRDFFEAAVNTLYRERSQRNCTYREAIIKTQKEMKVSNEQLRKLCSEGVKEIYT